MPNYRKRFTKEEKLEIVQQSLGEEVSLKKLGSTYGVHANTINRWRREFLKYEQDAFPGPGKKLMTESEREIHELKKRLREAQLERDILKKAISIFSKSDRKNMNL